MRDRSRIDHGVLELGLLRKKQRTERRLTHKQTRTYGVIEKKKINTEADQNFVCVAARGD